MTRKLYLILASLIIIAATIHRLDAEAVEQIVVSATPVPANVPSPLPLVVTDVIVSTPTQAERTPTPLGPVLLEALTEANVRSQPDPESERLGTIRAGDQYAVIGRYFRWYRFQYNQTSSGVGWVFDELVKIIGDESAIVDLTQGEPPTQDPAALAITATLAVLTQTPGGVLTASAAANVIALPIVTQSNDSTPQANGVPIAPEVLPTFTFPPNIPLLVSTDALSNTLEQATTTTNDTVGTDLVIPTSIPPVLPILILGGLGILGLIISSARR